MFHIGKEQFKEILIYIKLFFKQKRVEFHFGIKTAGKLSIFHLFSMLQTSDDIRDFKMRTRK